MSYLVLARKYRSRSFNELVGQEHVVKALTNALTQGRLHHAYLFTGTRGVGKTSVSRILAKSLNCVGADGQGGITAHPCGVCHACRDIDAGRFVDYIELDAASNRGVDEITTLLDQAVYKPVVGRFKVYMIDEVHMLSTTAFNAMLKTLEEPPDYLKFVLATTDPQKVPPTVLSRCLQFNLRPMAPQTVQHHLAKVLGDESIEADAGSLRLLSRAARGSMRDALSLTDQAIAYGAGRLTESGVREMLGAVDRGHAVRIVESLAACDGAALVAAADGLRGLGLSAAGTLDELAELLQQMAVTQAVPDALDESDPESQTVRRLATLMAADELQLLYSMALHGRAELGLAPDEYSGLVMVLLRMLAFRPGEARRSAPGRIDAEVAPDASTPPGPTVGMTAAPAIEAASAASRVSPSPSITAVAAVAAIERVPGEMPESVSRPVPRQAALRTSTGMHATVVAAMPGPPMKVDAAARIGGEPPGAFSAAAFKAMPSAVALVANPVATPVAARVATPETAETSETADFGEPPPWLDVPFDADDDVALMPPPVEALVTADASGASNVRVEAVEPMPRQVAPASPLARSAAANPTSMAASTSPSTVSFVATPFGDRWADVVDRMSRAGSIGALVRELALQSECIHAAVVIGADASTAATGAGLWRLRVERESLRAPGLVEKLRVAMSTLFDGEVQLEVERGPATDSTALRNSAERDRRQREAERLIHDDPLVKQLLSQYRTARIVPGSIKPV